MIRILQKILRKYKADGWNLTQREALVDLLLLGTDSDNWISLTDSVYLQTAVPGVKAAKGRSDLEEDLLRGISDRLCDNGSRQKAVGELETLLLADGIVKPEEEFMEKVKRIVGI